jgi:hypothetical protein
LTQTGKYTVAVSLKYRKVDQFLLNFLFGEKTDITSPVTEIAHATATVLVKAQKQAALKSEQRTAFVPHP